MPLLPLPPRRPGRPDLRSRARRPLVLAAAAALLALPACSGDGDSDSDGSGGGGSAPATGTVPAAVPTDIGLGPDQPTTGADPVDACALLTAAEVRALLPGAPAEGAQPVSGTCEWKDRASYNVVRVLIGGPGTAAGGTLPPPALPSTINGPDGIRFTLGYSVGEFEVGGRACQVQILNGKDDEAQMVATIAKVRDRLGS